MSEPSRSAGPKSRIDRIADLVSSVMLGLCIVIFCVMVFSVSYGVIGCYIPFIRNPRWTQELAILCMVWICFVSSGYAIKNGWHVRITLIERLLPVRIQRVMQVLAYALLLAINVFFVVYGRQIVAMTSRARMSATGWPMSITYLSVIVGGIYGALMSLYRILKGGQLQ